jgi:putative hemin transport protein
MIEDLKDRVAHYKADNPRAFARDIAESLGVSEAELMAIRCGEDVTALDGRYKELFEALHSLGSIKTITRNQTAVLERWGAFERVEIEHAMGQVVGDEIDLRLFLRNWRSGFAVEDPSPKGVRRSLQFFDAYGASIHKVYLEDESHLDAYRDLVARHRAEAPAGPFEPEPAPLAERSDRDIDAAGLCAAWDAMQNTHEFFGLLRRFGVSRTQALRLGGVDRARPVAATSLDPTLHRAAEAELPIMIFVGNRGMIQIHSGAIRNVQRMHGWLNVLDARFNLHAREDGIASAWVVRKPTVDGTVTSLELFDTRGESVLLMFSKRKPGAAEDPRWRYLVASLTAAPGTSPPDRPEAR